MIDLPNSHLQYAVTWYGLAAALAVRGASAVAADALARSADCVHAPYARTVRCWQSPAFIAGTLA